MFVKFSILNRIQILSDSCFSVPLLCTQVKVIMTGGYVDVQAGSRRRQVSSRRNLPDVMCEKAAQQYSPCESFRFAIVHS
jgi:hypothetical protein